MIQVQTATVYYAKTKGRRYLTKNAAIRAEAEAVILRKYPLRDYEPDTGFYVDIRISEPVKFERIMRSMIYKLKISK